MNKLQVIEEQEVLGKDFKIYGTVDKPMFLAKDVAEWIDYSWNNSKKTARKVGQMLETVDEDEKIKAIIGTLQCSTPNSRGGLRANTEMWFLTEDGLYEVLMQSRKPIAKKFKKEVKNILKDIRKHGMYATDELLENPDLLIKVATALKEEKEKNRQLSEEVAIKNQRIGELEPKADYTNIILDNKGLVTITQIAKDYGMSGRIMNSKLNELGVQYKTASKQWLLYAKYHDKGYTHSKTINITRSDGTPDVKMETKWTQKGRLFIYELLKENGILPVIERKDDKNEKD